MDPEARRAVDGGQVKESSVAGHGKRVGSPGVEKCRGQHGDGEPVSDDESRAVGAGGVHDIAVCGDQPCRSLGKRPGPTEVDVLAPHEPVDLGSAQGPHLLRGLAFPYA